MEELSIEEKAKRYDEAIAKGRQIQNTPYTAHWDTMKEVVEHLFPELKENKDEVIRKALIELVRKHCVNETRCIMEEWLEKQGEQKSDDKVKAKQISDLEKGKWYVCDTPRYRDFIVGKAYYCPKNEMLKLKEDELPRYVAKHCFHPWTIQDAKDGDVLAEHETIVLFKEIEGQNIRCYCTYHYLGFNPSLHVDTLHNKNAYFPATQEQRDLLFQKMEEAGYEWDAEKKELKKVEEKPADNIIEEEKPLLEKFKQAVYDCAWIKVTCKKEGETKEEYANRWAEHFLLMVRDWADDYIDYAIQQKLRKSYDKGKEDAIKTNSPAWSEEDEINLGKAIWYVENPAPMVVKDSMLVDWLKSLKARYTWKPSEEQMSILWDIIGNLKQDNYKYVCVLQELYNDLKKLK